MEVSMRGLLSILFVCFSFMYADQQTKIPLVFHKKYDISFFGIEKLHPFDTQKYSKVFDYVTSTLNIKPEHCYTPDWVTDEDLLLVHTKTYLDSLNRSSTVSQIAEIPLLSWVPNFLLRWRLLEPMRYATDGTAKGAKLALEYGWSINLSGGYHHAKADQGDGFCFYADIPLAIYKLRETYPKISVMIIDLDAHQGNGIESIFKNDPNVYIFDVYNKDIYPRDEQVKQYITFNHPVSRGIKDDAYLSLLDRTLSDAIATVKPNLIIYNAGTDIYEHDPLGAMKITADGIIKRDALVFTEATKRNIPILMVLSGGYTKASWKIIGKSVVNILQNIINFTVYPKII